MLFSIIVPFLNEEKYVEQCANSLLGQDFDKDEYEIIFVDNGSVDRSLEIVRQFDGINVLTAARKNDYVARNIALRAARGEIIAFTDADCAAARDWLTQIYAGMRGYGASIAIGRISFPESARFPLKIIEDYDSVNMERLIYGSQRECRIAYTNNMAVKKDIFERFGLFLEWHRAADVEFLQRCICREPELKTAYISGMKVTHLEMTSLGIWIGRNFIYGSRIPLVRVTEDFAPQGLRTSWRTYSDFVKERRYGFTRMAILLFLLAVRYFSYRLGMLAGMCRNVFIKKRASS